MFCCQVILQYFGLGYQLVGMEVVGDGVVQGDDCLGGYGGLDIDLVQLSYFGQFGLVYQFWCYGLVVRVGQVYLVVWIWMLVVGFCCVGDMEVYVDYIVDGYWECYWVVGNVGVWCQGYFGFVFEVYMCQVCFVQQVIYCFLFD